VPKNGEFPIKTIAGAMKNYMTVQNTVVQPKWMESRVNSGQEVGRVEGEGA
jgi:hypothetical protein